MGKKEKLIKRLLSVPKDFTFEEMQTLLKLLDFEMSNKGRTSGSRVEFFSEKITIVMHKPHPRKELREYQIKKIIEKLKEGGFI